MLDKEGRKSESEAEKLTVGKVKVNDKLGFFRQLLGLLVLFPIVLDIGMAGKVKVRQRYIMISLASQFIIRFLTSLTSKGKMVE